MRRSFCITCINPKSYCKCPYKRDTQGRTRKRRSSGTSEVEIRVIRPQPRNAGSYQKLEETRSRFFPRALGESAALLTP